MKSFFKFCGLISVLFLSFFSFSYGVSVSIPDSQGASGSTVQIPINIDNAEGVAGFQFTVTFDNSVLNATGAIAGSLTSGWSLQVNTQTAGQITVAGFNPSVSGLSGGSGSLVKLVFNVVGASGSSTNLNFSFSKLVDANGNTISSTSQNGSFTVEGQQQKVAKPTFSPAPGTYTGSVDVTISCSTSGATIRYTLDGSEPTETSTQYTGPIHLTQTTTIKAKGFKEGMTPSDTATGTYTITPSGEQKVVSIPASGGISGSTVQIPINIDNAEGVAGFQFTVTFDNSVLNATGAIAGSLTSGWSLQVNTQTAGQITVAGFNPSVSGLSGGSGSLVKLVFNVVGASGSSTNLNFSVSKLTDSYGQQILHTNQNGSFTVAGGTISGHVTLQGGTGQVTQVLLTLSGASSATTHPDGNGNYTFTNLSSGNYTITPSLTGYRFVPSFRSITSLSGDVTGQDFTGIYQCTLTVNSEHDNPTCSPADNNGKSSGTGTYIYDYGTSITTNVTSPADETNGTRYVCTGWTGTGSVPTSGTKTNTTFTITQNSTITWNWATEYKLTKISNPAEGGIITLTGNKDWYLENSSVTVTAVPNSGWIFTGWSGDLSGTTNPQTLVMDRPKTVIANFVQQDFSLEVIPDIISTTIEDITQPDTTRVLTINVKSIGGFNKNVGLTYTINPSTDRITGALSRTSVVPNGSSTLTLTISGNTTPDTYIVTITGTSDGLTHSIEVPFVVSTLVYIPEVYPETNADTQIEIPVMISNAKRLCGFQLKIKFDPGILSPIGAKKGNLTGGWTISQNPGTGEITVGGFGTSELGEGSGSIAIIQVQIIGEIPDDGTPLIIDSAKPSDISAKSIPVVSRNGVLKPGIPGDINRDGVVDIFDVILCLRMALGIDSQSLQADMNVDGIVDIFDVILVLRKALGID